MTHFRHDRLSAVVNEVLHYVWDPIGVVGIPQARDEYDGYVGAIVSLLASGASEEEIKAHLMHLADVRIGLPGREKQSADAASLLVDWREYLAEDGA